MNNGHIQFDFNFGRHRPDARPRREEEPFRILVLGNIGGRSAGQTAVPFAQRKPVSVDIDNLDRVFRSLAPRLALELDAAPLTIGFSALEDFHPDRLFQRLDPIAALRKLREELDDPITFRRAALALGALPATEAQAPVAEDDGATVERLLGRRPPVMAERAGVDLGHWLQRVVAPYIMPDIAHDQRQLIAAVDTAIAGQMRQVLHHPAFQALEASWRGIERLVRTLETGEMLQLFVLDASREELTEDIEGSADDLSRSTLYRHLCGLDTEPPDGHRWSLLVGDYAFGPGHNDLRLLAALGAIAAHAEAPLLAAACRETLGCEGLAQLADPASWKPLDADTRARWNAFRKSPVAPWIGLALPGILARLPYGASTDPITSFAFEELPASRDHEAYLWGNPAFALALLAAQAFQDDGWNMDPDSRLDITDLPSHTYREDGETYQQPCAELLMSESAGTAVAQRGIMPLLSYRNRNAARLLRWQSMSDPPRPLQGAWNLAGYSAHGF